MSLSPEAEERCRLRNVAKEILTFVGDNDCQIFWELLKEECEAKLPPKPEPKVVDPYPPMEDEEAIFFENLTIGFGKHVGEKVWQVPPSYLEYLTYGNEFTEEVKRYVKSERFKKRAEEETDQEVEDEIL